MNIQILIHNPCSALQRSQLASQQQGVTVSCSELARACRPGWRFICKQAAGRCGCGPAKERREHGSGGCGVTRKKRRTQAQNAVSSFVLATRGSTPASRRSCTSSTLSGKVGDFKHAEWRAEYEMADNALTSKPPSMSSLALTYFFARPAPPNSRLREAWDLPGQHCALNGSLEVV